MPRYDMSKEVSNMGQLDNVQISGQNVSVIFPTSFTLPPTVQMTKTSDHELTAQVEIIVKKMFGLVTIKQQVTLYWNLATGTFKVTLT